MQKWTEPQQQERSLSEAIRRRHVFCLLLLMMMAIPVVFAQQARKELEDRRKKLLKEIETTSQLLKQTKQNKEATLSRYVTLQKQIGHRQQLLETLEAEVKYLDENMERTSGVVIALGDDLNRLKQEYAKMARHALRQRLSRNDWLFVFSAKSFNDAIRRWQYLRQYDRYRQKQARLIFDTQTTLMGKINTLEERKKEKQQLIGSTQRQAEMLNLEVNAKNRLIEELKGSESRLARDLDSKRSAAEKLSAAIEKIIKEEMERIRREEIAATLPATAGSRTLPSASPESASLSKVFQNNKGKLPWPVKNGIITSRFGRQPHPTIPNIEIVNNGIDIRTDGGSYVRAVFDGAVVGTQFIPGYDYMVILQHGAYYTVYSNLEEISVKKGDKISIRQNIGKVSTNRKTNTSEVHFEIWKEKNRLNPQDWVGSN